MEIEEFETVRDFEKKYPSKIYICSNCNFLTIDPKTCNICGWRADGLFKTMNKGLKYKIKETKTTDEIFRPLENKGEDYDK